jgi:hypothetical protein
VSEPFVAAVDRALGARGRLVALYPAVVIERAVEREKRSKAPCRATLVRGGR